MVFNATFNNISVLSCWSVLLVEETGVPAENHRPVAHLFKFGRKNKKKSGKIVDIASLNTDLNNKVLNSSPNSLHPKSIYSNFGEEGLRKQFVSGLL
jgi:hypothetical protein